MEQESLEVRVARIDERTASIDKNVEALSAALNNHYVSKDEFTPVRNIVYGATALILTSVLVALLSFAVTAGTGDKPAVKQPRVESVK